MGCGDIKAKLATVGPPAFIVPLHRSWGGGPSEKIPCMERHFCSLSNTTNVKQPGKERTPTLWLITPDKDKGKRKGGALHMEGRAMARMVARVWLQQRVEKRLRWWRQWGRERQRWCRMAVCCGMAN